MGELARYDEACRAIAAAKAVDEVKEILNQAEAIKHYARQAENRTLEADAIEIRFRAERRLGEMLTQQKNTLGLNRGSRGQLRGRDASGGTISEQPEDDRPTLAEAGISRKLSAHAQKMAAVPAAKFEAAIATFRDDVASAKGRMTTDLLKVGAEEEQRQARRDLAQALSDKAAELTGSRRYPCIYFDPPWKRKQGLTNRSYENHYPTMTWDEIITWARQMAHRLLDDAWGLMWIPRAHMLALHPVETEAEIVGTGEIVRARVKMPLAWAIAEAMGFDQYSTAFIWTKTDEDFPDDIGAGILVRDQDEVLLMFKKGRGLPKPASYEVVGSNHRERSKPLGHSRKPQHYRDMIARMTGGVSVLECFGRHDENFPLPLNWDAWGNEAQPESAVAAPISAIVDAIEEVSPPSPPKDDGLDIPAFLRRDLQPTQREAAE